MAITRYHLGCPVWGRREWVGELFAGGTKRSEWLAHYARVFNAVEGNTTFYAVPSTDTIARWRDQTPPSFAFCFKLPRPITHDKRLRGARRETEAFLTRIEPLGSRLGPVMIQLPAAFGPSDLPALEDFLVALPGGFAYAVEVRHGDLHVGSAADELDAVLHTLAIDRVVLDATALHRAPAHDDPVTAETQRRKPNLPVRAVVTASRPLVRFIGGPDVDADEDLLQGWADRVAQWIDAGSAPYVFMHTPDDRHAPRLANAFHRLLSQRRDDVGPMPRFLAGLDPRGEQLKLL